MFLVKMLIFTHLRKKNLAKFEYRNTGFYFDFREFVFRYFGHLAFLCSNLYSKKRTHCEYHARSEDAQLHPCTKEKLTEQNLNIEIQDFTCISIFVFRYSDTWRFCAEICTIESGLIANIMFLVKMLIFTQIRKKKLAKFYTGFYFDFRFSIFGHLAFFFRPPNPETKRIIS